MRIIVNSDVLWTKNPVRKSLPPHLEKLFQDAAGAGAVLAVPRTTLLEYERHQSELCKEEIVHLDSAAKRLGKYGIAVPLFDPNQLVKPGVFADLARASGIKVEIEHPRYEDYEDAERRACMHLSPAPAIIDEQTEQSKSSDEMRDLVIWAVAVRIAKRDGGAILFSRDKVHNSPAGAAEASSAHLFRAKTPDEVREYLGQESPTGVNARKLLVAAWPALRTKLPLPEDVTLRRVSDASFEVDAHGHLSGSFSFSADATKGKLSATASVEERGPSETVVSLSDIRFDGQQWETDSLSLPVAGSLPLFGEPVGQPLQDLRDTIGGSR